MRVTLQVRDTRKPYNWTTVFSARVLFADRRIILVRGAGTNSLFDADGQFQLAGWNPKHPAAKRVPKNHGAWRIHPKSLKRLKDCLW